MSKNSENHEDSAMQDSEFERFTELSDTLNRSHSLLRDAHIELSKNSLSEIRMNLAQNDPFAALLESNCLLQEILLSHFKKQKIYMLMPYKFDSRVRDF